MKYAKKNHYVEIAGVLSLSLILTCAFAVSGSIPAMLEEFSEYSRSSVELLLSLPSFATMIMIALSPLVSKLLPERKMLTAGLLIYSISGLIPVFFHSYEVIFTARICLGIGTGLVNAKAVTMIGERFSGELRQKLSGIRCSMETLGQAALTMTAGQLLVFGWNYSFLIYGIGFLLLFIVLVFIPEKKTEIREEKEASDRMTGQQWIFVLSYALLGFLMVSTNVSNSLRIPSYVIETGVGTAVDGSVILSISTMAGFLAGLLFGGMIKRLKEMVLPCSLTLVTAGLMMIFTAGSLTMMGLGISICGFAVTLGTSYIFNRVPEQLPAGTLATANAVVLMGCNLGAFAAPFVLKVIGLISPSLKAGFAAYAAVYAVLIAGILLKKLIKK